MLDRIVLHGEFSLFTVRGNFWYQIYRNRRKKVLCSRLSLITLTICTMKLMPRGIPYLLLVLNVVHLAKLKYLTT